jgi:adenylyl-sulfate kinase
MAADGRNVTVSVLNQRRADAVRLRLSGLTIEETARKSGLSAPTVIQACKAYRSGGWSAVPVGPRGRGIKRDPRRSVNVVAHENIKQLEGKAGSSALAAPTIPVQPVDVDKAARASLMGQRGFVLWFTGLSGAGKSTIANRVERRLHAMGRYTYFLDGDNVRRGLSRDLGFSNADRVENIRRVAEVARMMVDAGLIVLAAFISPFRAERRMARALFADGEFIEIFVDAPLDIVEQRDPKGLYQKARRGEIRNFTGIDSPYERPAAPEIHLETAVLDVEEAVARVLSMLQSTPLAGRR